MRDSGPNSTGARPAGEPAGFADRLETLEGATLAYVDWSKPNGDVLHEVYAELLADRYGLEDLSYFVKPTSSSPIPDAVREEILAADPDGAIFAIADCGSCNSTVVVDAVDLEAAGLPTAQIVTDAFLEMNRQISASYGHETMPLVSVPHPTRYLSRDAVRRLGERTVEPVHELLTDDDWSAHELEVE